MDIRLHQLKDLVFKINSTAKFSSLALDIFNYQARNNPVYSKYLELLGRKEQKIQTVEEIPFLPIEFFKREKVLSDTSPPELIFESSATTSRVPSRHYVADQQLYINSFTRCFELFLGKPSRYCILALLPSYLERKNSSLAFMADELIKISKHPLSGFFLNDYEKLFERLKKLEADGSRTILLGVAFALMDFAEKFPISLKNSIVIETGGMKGRRKEITRAELHSFLKQRFGVEKIYSEYGMTELLSQAYSTGNGIFKSPPWMKILVRNPLDPFEYLPAGETGALNIIDLANIHSCAFIQTDDLGKLHPDGTFEIFGRLAHAELRGCNLLLE